ncbi:hypothetical protein MMC11_005025 [Xylographa trunciseda]|nr:hypothetical protein [Xylographa trunciseda]
MSVVVPAKPKRKKLQVSYTLRPRRPPRIYVEYLDENGAVIQAAEPATPLNIDATQNQEDAKPKASASVNFEKKYPPAAYTSQDASTQTDFFWCACPKEQTMQSQPQSAKKQSKDKISKAVVQEPNNVAKKDREVKSKQSTGSKSEADILSIIEQATQRKSKSSKEPKAKVAASRAEKPVNKPERKEQEKKQPEKKQSERTQSEKKQSGKKQPEKQNVIQIPPQQARFNHLPRFPDPHRDPAISSSSSASDESNIDQDFAAFMAQVPPPGYISTMQEPHLYSTAAPHARSPELRHENGNIQRSLNRAGNLGRMHEINEEAAAERADETAAQQWVHERNAEASKAAAAWLEERQALRSQVKGSTPRNENDQAALRVADEQEAARWVEQRAKERNQSLANRNGWHADPKNLYQQDLRTEEYQKSPSPGEVVWDSTHNTKWTRPSEWTNLDKPPKSSLSRPNPRIWEDMENNADNQAKRVSFASPNLPADSNPHQDARGRLLNEMDTNLSHIPPYRRHTGLETAQDPPKYKPHSGRKSAYESLPNPVFTMGSKGTAAQSTRLSSHRNISEPFVEQRYEMSGALDNSNAPARAKKQNKKKVHYEAPSVASADSNDEDPKTDMLWVE